MVKNIFKVLSLSILASNISYFSTQAMEDMKQYLTITAVSKTNQRTFGPTCTVNIGNNQYTDSTLCIPTNILNQLKAACPKNNLVRVQLGLGNKTINRNVEEIEIDGEQAILHFLLSQGKIPSGTMQQSYQSPVSKTQPIPSSPSSSAYITSVPTGSKQLTPKNLRSEFEQVKNLLQTATPPPISSILHTLKLPDTSPITTPNTTPIPTPNATPTKAKAAYQGLMQASKKLQTLGEGNPTEVIALNDPITIIAVKDGKILKNFKPIHTNANCLNNDTKELSFSPDILEPLLDKDLNAEDRPDSFYVKNQAGETIDVYDLNKDTDSENSSSEDVSSDSDSDHSSEEEEEDTASTTRPSPQDVIRVILLKDGKQINSIETTIKSSLDNELVIDLQEYQSRTNEFDSIMVYDTKDNLRGKYQLTDQQLHDGPIFERVTEDNQEGSSATSTSTSLKVSEKEEEPNLIVVPLVNGKSVFGLQPIKIKKGSLDQPGELTVFSSCFKELMESKALTAAPAALAVYSADDCKPDDYKPIDVYELNDNNSDVQDGFVYKATDDQYMPSYKRLIANATRSTSNSPGDDKESSSDEEEEHSDAGSASGSSSGTEAESDEEEDSSADKEGDITSANEKSDKLPKEVDQHSGSNFTITTIVLLDVNDNEISSSSITHNASNYTTSTKFTEAQIIDLVRQIIISINNDSFLDSVKSAKYIKVKLMHDGTPYEHIINTDDNNMYDLVRTSLINQEPRYLPEAPSSGDHPVLSKLLSLATVGVVTGMGALIGNDHLVKMYKEKKDTKLQPKPAHKIDTSFYPVPSNKTQDLLPNMSHDATILEGSQVNQTYIPIASTNSTVSVVAGESTVSRLLRKEK